VLPSRINTGTGIHYQGLTNGTRKLIMSLTSSRHAYRLSRKKLGFTAVSSPGGSPRSGRARVNFEMMWVGIASVTVEEVSRLSHTSPLPLGTASRAEEGTELR